MFYFIFTCHNVELNDAGINVSTSLIQVLFKTGYT